MLFEALVKEMAEVVAEGKDRQQEFFFGGYPLALVEAQTAARRQIVNVGMINEGATPGVQDTQQAQRSSETPGIGGQVLQGLGTGIKEQVIAGFGMRTHPVT